MANFTFTLSSNFTATELLQKVRTNDQNECLKDIGRLLAGTAVGSYNASSLEVRSGAVQASGTITFSSTGPVADETVTVNGVVFTGKASGATGDQWNISATPSVNATNLAAAINASASAGIANVVTASADSGVVTVTCDVPGTIGNSLALAESATNTAVSGAALAGGTDGTVTSFSL